MQNGNKLYQAVLSCTKLYQAIPDYAKLNQPKPSNRKPYKAVSSYTIPSYTRLYKAKATYIKL